MAAQYILYGKKVKKIKVIATQETTKRALEKQSNVGFLKKEVCRLHYEILGIMVRVQNNLIVAPFGKY